MFEQPHEGVVRNVLGVVPITDEEEGEPRDPGVLAPIDVDDRIVSLLDGCGRVDAVDAEVSEAQRNHLRSLGYL